MNLISQRKVYKKTLIHLCVSVVISKGHKSLSTHGTFHHLKLEFLFSVTVSCSEGGETVEVERVVIGGVHGVGLDIVLQGLAL